MIPLSKTEKPKVLVDNADRWHTELRAVIARGEKPTDTMKSRYRHDQIKTALIAETHGKCAYCESKLRHVTHGDIEHIAPKSKVPSKTYEWTNLTLACDHCNENKDDYFNQDPSQLQDNLVDPYVDNPADHFVFARELVLPRPDSMRGYLTDEIIKISRNDLVERRRERMEFIERFVTAITQAEDVYKDMLIRDLHNNHLKVSDEYSGAANAYIRYLENIGAIRKPAVAASTSAA